MSTTWQNWQYRALALLLALACWYVVSGQEKVETWLEIPLEFVNLPQRMEVTSGMVNKIQVRIRGTSSQVRALNDGRLAYKLDMGAIQVGSNVIPLTAESMAITSAVEVVEINPSRLELVADILISKDVPVHLDWTGMPGEDLRFNTVEVTPKRVTITGLASALDAVQRISTVQVQVQPGNDLAVSGQAWLLLPKDVRASVPSVEYALSFSYITQELWVKISLEPVERHAFSYTFEPKFLRVLLEIPVRLLRNKDWRDTLHLVLDPGPNPSIGQSVIRPAPRLPEGVKVLEMKPEEVEIVVQRNES